MKYLNKYETHIKHSDPRAVENKMNSFGQKIKKLLEKLQKYDNFEGSKVRIYFDDIGEVMIQYYNKKSQLLRITIDTEYDDVRLSIMCPALKNYWHEKEHIQDVIRFREFTKEELKEYEYHLEDDFFYGIYKFPITKSNDVIDKLEKYHDIAELNYNTNKYNL